MLGVGFIRAQQICSRGVMRAMHRNALHLAYVGVLIQCSVTVYNCRAAYTIGHECQRYTNMHPSSCVSFTQEALVQSYSFRQIVNLTDENDLRNLRTLRLRL